MWVAGFAVGGRGHRGGDIEYWRWGWGIFLRRRIFREKGLRGRSGAQKKGWPVLSPETGNGPWVKKTPLDYMSFF